MSDVRFLDRTISAATVQFVVDAKQLSGLLDTLPFATSDALRPYIPTKISAIKRLREETQLSLKDALEFVNLVWDVIDYRVLPSY